jgi:prephenate dehydrogenase
VRVHIIGTGLLGASLGLALSAKGHAGDPRGHLADRPAARRRPRRRTACSTPQTRLRPSPAPRRPTRPRPHADSSAIAPRTSSSSRPRPMSQRASSPRHSRPTRGDGHRRRQRQDPPPRIGEDPGHGRSARSLHRQPSDGRAGEVRGDRRSGGSLHGPTMGDLLGRGHTESRLGEVIAMAEDTGASVLHLDPRIHDAAVAKVSHVPQVVSSLVASQLRHARSRRSPWPGRDCATSPASPPRIRVCGRRS